MSYESKLTVEELIDQPTMVLDGSKDLITVDAVTERLQDRINVLAKAVVALQENAMTQAERDKLNALQVMGR